MQTRKTARLDPGPNSELQRPAARVRPVSRTYPEDDRYLLGAVAALCTLLLMLLLAGSARGQAGTGPGGVGDAATSIDLTLWLRSDRDVYTDAGCSNPAGDTDSVACWQDQSSNGNDAVQSLVVRQATRRDNVLNASNGKSVLRFDGGVGGDGAGDFMDTTAVPATGADPRTLIAVINDGSDNGLAYQHVLHYGSNGFADAYGLCFRTNSNQTSGTGSNIGNHYWSIGFSSNQTQTSAPLILNITYNGTVDELFANGATQGTKTVTLSTMSNDGIRLATRVNTTDGAEFFDGDIAEVIAFGDVLSKPKRVLIDNYLSSKFDIALTSGDKYDGDTVGNGDHDEDVAGIGRDAGASHTSGASAGLFLNDAGFLQQDGDYLLAGHALTQNAAVSSDLPAGVLARMQRVWYLDLSDTGGDGGAVQLAFDFVLAGLDNLPGNDQDFHLLARAGTSGDFTSIATSTTKSGDQILFDLADVATDLVDLGPYVTVGFTPDADLAITKTDGQTEATTGEPITYTLVVTNMGASTVTGATVTDTFPSEITGVSWTCTPSSGSSSCTASGSGDISETVTIAAGDTLTYSASGTLSLTASGTVSNTATVAVPSGSADPDPSDNSATDVDTVIRSADLSITKTDGETLVEDGEQTTYTIVATNEAGSVDVVGATVDDIFPAALTCSWTCAASAGASCTAGPVLGDIDDTVDLIAGATVTYTATCGIAIDSAGSLSNTATIGVPGGITDPDLGNNEATDTTKLRKIFLDGFETGDTVAWTRTIGQNMMFDFGGARQAFYASFHLAEPQLLQRTPSELLVGLSEDGRALFSLDGRVSATGQRQWRLRVTDGSGIWYNSAWLPAPPSRSLIEMTWLRQTVPNADGRIRLDVDGERVFDLAEPGSSSLHQLRLRDFGDQRSIFDWEDIQLK